VSVSEKLMQLGEWDIRLSPETPLSLRQAFAKWDKQDRAKRAKKLGTLPTVIPEE
jgi:hypothetical protein